MFGTKLKSWMEAHIVLPRKKQQRKEPAQKKEYDPNKTPKKRSLKNEPEQNCNQKVIIDDGDAMDKSAGLLSMQPQCRSTVTNLSSPESAYSTGYSTDGTSPGASFPPPEYYVSARTGTKYFHSTTDNNCINLTSTKTQQTRECDDIPKKISWPVSDDRCWPRSVQSDFISVEKSPRLAKPQFLNNPTASPALTSPRQRNRIRTNPWLQDSNCSTVAVRNLLQNNRQTRNDEVVYPISPQTWVRSNKDKNYKCENFSSSSCSSLSAASVNSLEKPVSSSVSDDDDRTLNEMMGKYDESYVYEKETDILSDSDPTDCEDNYEETDGDTGQDGGDERDPLDDDDLDFIDNNSFKECLLDVKELYNKGHCHYYFPADTESKNARRIIRCSTRRANIAKDGSYRSKNHPEGGKRSEKQRRMSSRRRNHSGDKTLNPLINRVKKEDFIKDGTRSAGATPVSIRRKGAAHQTNRKELPGTLKKRSNSLTGSGGFDAVDLEADKKYRELIIEAEHILMSMKNTPSFASPRRTGIGVANKRVEILRNAEVSNKVDEMNNKPVDVPSRLSPKRNHITNFISSNSPLLARREMDPPLRGTLSRMPAVDKVYHKNGNCQQRKSVMPLRRENSVQTKHLYTSKASQCDSSDESDTCKNDVGICGKKKYSIHCPQSEPVKRKIYSSVSNGLLQRTDGLQNSESELGDKVDYEHEQSPSHRRLLLRTIANLKKNLEDQSATLKRAYTCQQ